MTVQVHTLTHAVFHLNPQQSLVKDRKSDNSESEMQVNEHCWNDDNSLYVPHGNIRWSHLITVLTKHIHMLPAPSKPIIKRGNSDTSTTNLAFHLLGGKNEPTMYSLTRS